MGDCGGERLGIGTNKTNARGTASPGGDQQSQAPVERCRSVTLDAAGMSTEGARALKRTEAGLYAINGASKKIEV